MLPALQRQTPSDGTRFPLRVSAISEHNMSEHNMSEHNMSEHNRLRRHALAAAMFVCIGAFAAHAHDAVIERQLKAAPGRDRRAGVFTDIRPDCPSGPLP